MHKHTNRLANETSPYLLQHAHNPVDWFAWSNEAFNMARQLDKPVLVSIGYSACHWCHVMERESFENEETARYMNEHFVNIKIDREERPDIDHIYMDAVQAMTGSGGWPLNVFLLPDGRPFFGGTYFPPRRAFNRSSWVETLQAVSQAFEQRRDELETQAENLTQHIGAAGTMGIVADATTNEWFSEDTQQAISENLLKNADTRWGGFGRAPKFPQTFAITYLLRHYYFTKDQKALDHALLSLDKMMYGGIYDHLGGGFARYSTDEQWLAPHFEKMLYDNALLINCYAEAFQLTHKPEYAETIRQTLDFVTRELMSDEGGFFSALDADSEGVEGKFYTWSKEEIDAVLGDESPLFCRFYGVEADGNWEHTNILWVKQPVDEIAAAMQGGETATLENIADVKQILEQGRSKLFNVRAQRVRPGLDDKILLSWNALMNIAFCKAYAALQNDAYRDTAVANMQFLEDNFFDAATGGWLHTYKDGKAKYPAFLDDLSYLALAYIHLQEITGNAGYLLKAQAITNLLISDFKDEGEPYFYFTSKHQQDVIVRKKELYDGATPSGNAVMTYVLLYLAKVFDNSEWYELAINMLRGLEQTMVKYPTSFGFWAGGLQFAMRQVNEIAIVGLESSQHLPAILHEYIPDKVLQSAVAADDRFPLLAGKPAQQAAQFFLCKKYACQQPVFTPAELVKMVKTGADKGAGSEVEL